MIEKNNGLTAEELLTALKYCDGSMGGSGCEGCPNAVPGTVDKHGLCACRYDVVAETIRILENLMKNEVKQ